MSRGRGSRRTRPRRCDGIASQQKKDSSLLNGMWLWLMKLAPESARTTTKHGTGIGRPRKVEIRTPRTVWDICFMRDWVEVLIAWKPCNGYGQRPLTAIFGLR